MPQFATGDLFLGCTDVDDRNVDLRKHAGAGRVLWLDKAFQLKGELRTGKTGLVVGLALDPGSGDLYVCDPGSQSISVFDANGQLQSADWLPQARIGAITFTAVGQFVAGLHSRIGEDPANPAPRLYLGDAANRSITRLAAEVDGGRQGFHCVTHVALAADGRTLYYVSEGGRRLMRFDLSTRRQLPDFLTLAAADPRGSYGPAVLADGRVLMATGNGAALYSAKAELLAEWQPEPNRGWSRLTLAQDQRSFYLSNFLDGILEQRGVDEGELIFRFDVNRKYALTGLAEFP